MCYRQYAIGNRQWAAVHTNRLTQTIYREHSRLPRQSVPCATLSVWAQASSPDQVSCITSLGVPATSLGNLFAIYNATTIGPCRRQSSTTCTTRLHLHRRSQNDNFAVSPVLAQQADQRNPFDSTFRQCTNISGALR